MCWSRSTVVTVEARSLTQDTRTRRELISSVDTRAYSVLVSSDVRSRQNRMLSYRRSGAFSLVYMKIKTTSKSCGIQNVSWPGVYATGPVTDSGMDAVNTQFNQWPYKDLSDLLYLFLQMDANSALTLVKISSWGQFWIEIHCLPLSRCFWQISF